METETLRRADEPVFGWQVPEHRLLVQVVCLLSDGIGYVERLDMHANLIKDRACVISAGLLHPQNSSRPWDTVWVEVLIDVHVWRIELEELALLFSVEALADYLRRISWRQSLQARGGFRMTQVLVWLTNRVRFVHRMGVWCIDVADAWTQLMVSTLWSVGK